VTENLASVYPEPVRGLLNVGLLHTSVTGREGHEPYAPCALSDLVNKGYDYWALGHVHQREVLCQDPWVVFPGNLQGRHARETGPKGATLIEVSDARILSVEHRELDVVRFGACRVDASGASSADEVLGLVRDSLTAALAQADGRLLAARVQVVGASAAHAALSRDSERFVAEIRALGSEIGGDELWIEKIRFATRGAIDLAEVAQRDDAVGQVFRGIRALRQSVEGRAELVRELGTLTSRLPVPLKSGPLALNFDDPAGLDALLEDVEQMLLPRLTGGNDA
jgi:DNA repair exonuclease SbcCD nuclease subunit